MMEKYYRFSGIELAVDLPEDRAYCDDMQLIAFRQEQVTDPHRYCITVVPRLEPPKGEELAAPPGSRIYGADGGYVRYIGSVTQSVEHAYIRAEHLGKTHRISVTEAMAGRVISPRLVLNALDVEHLVTESGGVILHASYIDWEGRGILFTAPSETGKTTQAELWKQHRGADIINGDRAVVIPRDGSLCAGGLPFSGSSRYCENRTLPLAAIVYLKQAPVTTIRRLKGMEAFRRVWEGVCINNWNREDTAEALNLVQKALEKIPVYELACTPDESAVTALETQIRKQVSK